MGQSRESTARSRFLGAELRTRREEAGWSALHLAQKMGWAASTVSRIETGERGATAVNLATYLALCGVVGEEQAALLDLARGREEDWWVCAHDGRGPDELDPLWFSCATANRISCYYPGSVPELLQSEEFSAWQLRHRLGAEAGEADIDELLTVRLARQQVLYRPVRCECVFYLHEPMLAAMPGPDPVRGGQLLHMAMLIGAGRVRIRVLPTGVDHEFPSVGRFWVLGFAGHAPVVCVQGDEVSVFGERAEDIAGYERIIGAMDELALSEAASAELIIRLADAPASRPQLAPVS